MQTAVTFFFCLYKKIQYIMESSLYVMHIWIRDQFCGQQIWFWLDPSIHLSFQNFTKHSISIWLLHPLYQRVLKNAYIALQESLYRHFLGQNFNNINFFWLFYKFSFFSLFIYWLIDSSDFWIKSITMFCNTCPPALKRNKKMLIIALQFIMYV